MFHPSAAEFENPMEYILSIRETAERFGICWYSAAPHPLRAQSELHPLWPHIALAGSIVPPPSWKPPFVLDRNKLKFPTRVQKINELMARAAHPSIGALPARASIGELLTAGCVVRRCARCTACSL